MGSFKELVITAEAVEENYQMLEDAHQLKRQGVDIVAGVVEAHGRDETETMIGDLERVPLSRIEYRNVTLEEMDVRFCCLNRLCFIGPKCFLRLGRRLKLRK